MALQARTEFAAAINQIASEKGVDTAVIVDAIEQAALAAYRKDLSFRNEAVPEDFDSLTAKINSSSGEIGIFRGEKNITPPGFARIAAQTAKQVMAQKLHEAEKGAIIDEYAQKVGTVISGAIQRQEGNIYFVDLGRAEGVMLPSEQVKDEFYSQNQRMKFFIREIRESSRGPEVVVSRSDPGLVKGLFALEVPEIQSGAVEIKEIAREAGGRTKVAVLSTQDGVDPVGSLVGQKGVRVQAVINELGEEKIDIISYSADPARFIAAALSPAKEVEVELNEEEKVAKVKIPESQLSLAIGKGGQNVRLAAKLTGWKIDLEGTVEEVSKEEKVEPKTLEEKIEQKEDVQAAADDSRVQDDGSTGPSATSSGPSGSPQGDTVATAADDTAQVFDPEGRADEAQTRRATKKDQDEVEVAPAADFEKVEEEKIKAEKSFSAKATKSKKATKDKEEKEVNKEQAVESEDNAK